MEKRILKPIRVRFAPSPTGRTHLGSGRTALYNFLLARQTGGKLVLRIEDTDQKRFVPGAEEELKSSLRWLGLEWDEGPDVGGDYGPYRQTQRKEIYQKYAQRLIEQNHAYLCFCNQSGVSRDSERKSRLKHRDVCPDRERSYRESAMRRDSGESHVIRFKMPPEGSITVADALRGDITVENKTLDDYILVKSDGLPVYHLAVVVDDHLMEITHVIRTSEWLPTFPLHGHIYNAYGWQQPVWIHPSLFLSPTGKGKLSKRESESLSKAGKPVFLGDMARLGYLPEAVANWAALMGWSYDDKTEFFTMEDLITHFSIDGLNPSPASLNFSKLNHFNGLHIRNLSVPDLASRIKPFLLKAGYLVDDEEKLLKVAEVLQVRIETLAEAPEKAGFFFKKEIIPEPAMLVGRKMTPAESLGMARQIYQLIETLPDFSQEHAEQPLRDLARGMGLKAGQVFGFLRNALTAETVTPPIFETMTIIGRRTVLNRLQNALNILESLVKG
jgi:glutamyl-tRNA synthetase